MRLAYTMLEARYAEAFTSGAAAVTVPAGNRLPGVPRTSLYAELNAACAKRVLGCARGAPQQPGYVDDQNSDAAAAYTIATCAWASYRNRGLAHRRNAARDNLTDRSYIGSVIVADSNGRFFEPARGATCPLSSAPSAHSERR